MNTAQDQSLRPRAIGQHEISRIQHSVKPTVTGQYRAGSATTGRLKPDSSQRHRADYDAHHHLARQVVVRRPRSRARYSDFRSLPLQSDHWPTTAWADTLSTERLARSARGYMLQTPVHLKKVQKSKIMKPLWRNEYSSISHKRRFILYLLHG